MVVCDGTHKPRSHGSPGFRGTGFCLDTVEHLIHMPMGIAPVQQVGRQCTSSLFRYCTASSALVWFGEVLLFDILVLMGRFMFKHCTL